METKQFAKFVESLKNDSEQLKSRLTNDNLNLWHGSMGLAGEAGEVIDIIKKTVAYGQEIDKAHLVEELGDVLYYVQVILNVYGLTIDDAIKANTTKLKLRYPNGTFSEEDAVDRKDKTPTYHEIYNPGGAF